MSLPNIISLARLLVVPVIINFMLDGQYTYAFWLCIAAGVSDAIDGFIAKRYDSVTTLGSYLDPLADKALLVSVYVTLGMQDHLEGWLVILVVSRDLLIVGAVVLSYLISHPVKIEPIFVSKANTFAQILLGVIVVADLGLDVLNGLGLYIEFLTYVVGVTTVLSGAMYLRTWIASVATWEDEEADTKGGEG